MNGRSKMQAELGEDGRDRNNPTRWVEKKMLGIFK